jgi:hypothetical protein
VARLGEHYRSHDGAKNGSVFRRYIGGALLRRLDSTSPCLAPGPGEGHWERQDEHACSRCSTTESAISDVLDKTFGFRCVQIVDQNERNRLEARIIATVAACTLCQPSGTWLGSHAYPPLVRSSGLWNRQHVGGPVATRSDLDRLATLVRSSPGRSVVGADRLDKIMLLIPCSAAKAGAEDPGFQPVHLVDLLGTTAGNLLDEGRGLAFARPGVDLETGSPLRPAIAYYTGQPYATTGVRGLLTQAIDRGLHCLIISGGYGVLRAEEPIHRYKAHLNQTRSVWSRRIAPIRRDYVHTHQIKQTITVVSQAYASVVPSNLTGDDLRLVPRYSRQVDHGAPLRVIPERVGAQLAEVLAQL